MSTRPTPPAADVRHELIGIRTPVPAAAFADPRTRMLLTNDGTTTALLEAALRVPITVVVQHQSLHSAARLPEDIRRIMGQEGDCQILLRRSILTTPDGQPISDNHVVISTHPDNPVHVDQCLPLGSTMRSAEIEHRRTILSTGQHPWMLTAPTSLAAGKTYLIMIGGHPRLHLTEVYNPDLFPAHLDLVSPVRSHGEGSRP